MEIVLGSAVGIEEIRKRICYILLAVLLIMSLAFMAERFENAMPVKAKIPGLCVRERMFFRMSRETVLRSKMCWRLLTWRKR